jgi:hypothetical protein
MGATMEDDDMSAGMVADAVLWAIFAASIAFIYFGIRMTKPRPKVAKEAYQPSLDSSLNRAVLDKAA